jgi:hypothetical protein
MLALGKLRGAGHLGQMESLSTGMFYQEIKPSAAKVHVSALWVKRGGKWMCEFSQETLAK